MQVKVWIKRRITKKYELHCIKKEQRFYQTMLTGEAYKGTQILFNQEILAWLIVVVTICLQMISLATTYEGSKVYFGGIVLPLGLSGAFLFALSIQTIVFYMSNAIRKCFKASMVVILIIATLCSTYFSYVGIYNHINSPIDYLTERYKQIYGNITDTYQVTQDETKNNMKEYTFELVASVNKMYTSLVKQVEENSKLNEKIQGIKVDSDKINPQTNALKKPNMSSYGDNLEQYYSDMAKYNAAVGNMITDATKQESNLKNQLYENEVKALLGGKTKASFTNDLIESEANKNQIEKMIQSMHQVIGGNKDVKTFDEKLMDIQQYILDYILMGKGDSQIVSTVLTQLYSQAITGDGNNSFQDFKKDLNSFILLSQKDTVIMKPLENIILEVIQEGNNKATSQSSLKDKDAMVLFTKMQAQIKSAAYTLNQTGKDQETIDLNTPQYRMHNLYVLPIKNLIEQKDTRAMAWFCLAFAVLIDGLTLMFAVMEGKEKTLLLAKKNKDITGNSKDSIEALIMGAFISNENGKIQKDSVTDARDNLRIFIDNFSLLPEGIQEGYAMWCHMGQLGRWQTLVAILCQLNLARILDQEEIPTKLSGQVMGGQYLLIRTKFIVWVNEKIVSLTANEAYIDDLQAMQKVNLNKGEFV